MTITIQPGDFSTAAASQRNAAALAGRAARAVAQGALRDALAAYADHCRASYVGTGGEYGALCIDHDNDEGAALAADIVALARKASERLASYRFDANRVDPAKLAVLIAETLDISAPVFVVIDAAIRAEVV